MCVWRRWPALDQISSDSSHTFIWTGKWNNKTNWFYAGFRKQAVIEWSWIENNRRFQPMDAPFHCDATYWWGICFRVMMPVSNLHCNQAFIPDSKCCHQMLTTGSLFSTMHINARHKVPLVRTSQTLYPRQELPKIAVLDESYPILEGHHPGIWRSQA